MLFHLTFALRALDRADDLAPSLGRTTSETPWIIAGRAIVAGELARAAEIYAETNSVYFEAYTRLRAAEAGDPNAQLEKAIAFFRSVGATRYINEGEALLAAAS